MICEGEWDAAGSPGLGYRAVSVPNGASGADGELSYLWDARDLLNRVEGFILATDSDDAGLELRANLVAHLGADRCAFIESYGTDAKDLNETLPSTDPMPFVTFWRGQSPIRSRASTRSTTFPSGPS